MEKRGCCGTERFSLLAVPSLQTLIGSGRFCLVGAIREIIRRRETNHTRTRGEVREVRLLRVHGSR